jgi:hypothetical protein
VKIEAFNKYRDHLARRIFEKEYKNRNIKFVIESFTRGKCYTGGKWYNYNTRLMVSVVNATTGFDMVIKTARNTRTLQLQDLMLEAGIPELFQFYAKYYGFDFSNSISNTHYNFVFREQLDEYIEFQKQYFLI